MKTRLVGNPGIFAAASVCGRSKRLSRERLGAFSVAGRNFAARRAHCKFCEAVEVLLRVPPGPARDPRPACSSAPSVGNMTASSSHPPHVSLECPLVFLPAAQAPRGLSPPNSARVKPTWKGHGYSTTGCQSPTCQGGFCSVDTGSISWVSTKPLN